MESAGLASFKEGAALEARLICIMMLLMDGVLGGTDDCIIILDRYKQLTLKITECAGLT